MLFLSFILLTGCNNSQSSGDGELSSVRIGTSSAGGNFYTLTVGMSEIIGKYTSINTTVEPVGGSEANIATLKEGLINMAMVNSSAAYNGYFGLDVFEGEPVDVRLIAQGQDSFRQIVVRKDSGIESISDFEGKRFIAERPSLPEMRILTEALFEVYGVSIDNVNIISTVNTPEALDALKIGSVDAAIIPGGAGSAELIELFHAGDFRQISIDSEKLDEVLANLPEIFLADVIPAGIYEGQNEDVIALKFNTCLVAQGELSVDGVYEITKALFDNHEEYAATHRLAGEWTIENTLTDPKIPFHEGAVKYFKEINVWNDELEQIQNSY